MEKMQNLKVNKYQPSWKKLHIMTLNTIMNDNAFMTNIVQIHNHSLSKLLIMDIAYELYLIPIKILSFWRKFRYMYYQYSSFSKILNILHSCEKLMCGRQRIESGTIFWDFENTRVFWSFIDLPILCQEREKKIPFHRFQHYRQLGIL